MQQKKCPVCNAVVSDTDVRCPVCTIVIAPSQYTPSEKTAPPAQPRAAASVFEPHVQYGEFGLRFVAMLIDTAIILAVVLPCLLIGYGSDYFSLDHLIKGPLDLLVSWLLPAVSVILFWILCGATPGKMLIGARIVDAATGQPAKPVQLIIRYYAYVISSIPLCAGFLAILSDKKRQGWHDKLAGTIVIRTPASVKSR